MANRAIAVSRVIWRKPIQAATDPNIRYETVGVIVGDIDRVVPPDTFAPEQVKSVIRFKRAGVPDIATAHSVLDVICAINGDVVLTLKDEGGVR